MNKVALYKVLMQNIFRWVTFSTRTYYNLIKIKNNYARPNPWINRSSLINVNDSNIRTWVLTKLTPRFKKTIKRIKYWLWSTSMNN